MKIFSQLLVTLLLVSSIYADEEQVIFLSPVDFGPWIKLDNENRVIGGHFYDYCLKLENKIGMEIKVKAVPLGRFIKESIGNRKFDITIINEGMLIKNTNYKRINHPFHENSILLIYRKNFNDCKQISSFATPNAFSKNRISPECISNKNLKTVIVDDFHKRLKLFELERVDAMVLGSYELSELTEFERNSFLALHKVKVLIQSQSYMFVNRNSVLNSPEYLKILEEFSKEMYNSSSYSSTKLK